MTVQSTPSDLAAWVLDHGVGLPPARQKQLAKGYRRLEAQTGIRGRAVVMYRERARKAEAERDEWRQTALDERAAALDALEQIRVRDARIKRLENRAASETARADEWRRKHRVMAGKRDAARRAWFEEAKARREAETRTKAVRDVLDNIDTSNDPALHDGFADVRRALDGDA